MVKNEIIEFHRGTKSELGGFLDAIGSDVEIVPTLCAVAMPSGIIKATTFSFLVDELFRLLETEKLDGIYLALHGSMCVENLDDPEGFLLQKLREKYPKIIIGCTLDHHANVSKEMIENVDFVVGFRTHPHVDHYEVGYEAAKLMVLPEITSLEKAFIRIPIITRAENRGEPVKILRERAIELMKLDNIYSVSFFVGYPWADVPFLGCSVFVLQKQGTSSSFIEDYASLFFDLKDNFHFEIKSVDEIPKLLRSKSKGPLILNELSDCTFGGASGDVVTTAHYLHKKRIEKSIVVGIVDPESVQKAFEIGIKSEVHFSIGGKICIQDNPPLKGEMEIVSLHENVQPTSPMLMESGMLFDKVALVKFGSVLLALIPYPGQIGGPAFLKAIGINALDFACIVVKEGMNPFVTYDGIASDIVMIDSPGFNPQNLSSRLYSKLIQPIYPIFPLKEGLYLPRRCL